MDWFAATCGGAALYAAGRWLQVRLHHRKAAGAARRAGSRRGIPLKAVVANCEAKWFLQELQQAMSGDHTAMVRVSHMLLAGYGTRRDEAAAAEWMRKAWAVQNFKEPADRYLQYEMLDFPNSDIPVLNDDQQQQHAGAPSAAAAGALAAAHLRQQQRQSSSSTRAAAAAAAEEPASVPQSPSPRAKAALDGGCSSSGSGGSSNGAQAAGSAAAGQAGSAQGSAVAGPVSTRQQPSLASTAQTAADSSIQTAQRGEAQPLPPLPPPLPQQQQQQCLRLVQQSVAAVQSATGQGVVQMQQQGLAVQHWPASVQVLSDLHSVCSSPCDTPDVSLGKQQQQQRQSVRPGSTEQAVLPQGSMQGP